VDWSVARNLLDPAILYFFLGILIGAVRSNLEVPAPVAKFLSLYLLVALGFKGGQSLSEAGLDAETFKVLGVAMLLAGVIPAYSFLVLRRRVSPFDAAAIAATYGSVSAVTFIAASQFVAARDVPGGGYMTVALVVMESPAIIMAVLLATYVRGRAEAPVRAPVLVGAGPGTDHSAPEMTSPGDGSDPGSPAGGGGPVPLKAVLHEAFTDGAHLLLIGSLAIGFLVGPDGGTVMQPFTNEIFKGLLAFFLLEMGLLVARQLREVRDVGPFLIGFGLVMPLINAALAMVLGSFIGLGVGDLTLLAVLAASGSYIVVPAVIRFAIPEARPSRYFTMALAVTFPFNVVVGIPLYYTVANWLAG
jgi:uncharacterized protein